MTRRNVRGRRGGGSVYYDKDRARWIGVLDLGADPETRQRVRRKVAAGTEAQAWDKLDELRAELKKAGTVGRQDITVEVVLRTCSPARRRGGRHPTRSTRTPTMRSASSPLWGRSGTPGSPWARVSGSCAASAAGS